ncbi:titin-like [Belonocnema kinseyi]|uniref:titin-like n=1 Tax=Belonocnema kinseyi TaxID=2817044 RepID=UPI00143D5669|nr:titin-like [Belonocnema kinseyi]XP_033221753.1 titin-like [Belonocnema kinseyi]
MSRNRGTMETVTWMLVENTVPDRLSNDSLTHALQFTSKIKKRTKIVNREIRKYSGLKSYNQYLDIKRSYLRNTSVDEESDYEPSSRSKIANSRDSNPDLLAYSSAEESEDDRDYDDILIGENPIISLSGREDENCSRRKESKKSSTENSDSETQTSRSPSIRNQHTSLRISVQPSTSRKSTVRKSKRVQTMLTNFLERKNISRPEETSSPKDEERQIEEKEHSETTESPPKTRVSPRKVSKPQLESSNKTSVQKRVLENRKLRNKTREDVKKNLSTIIGDSETENLTEKNSDKNKLNETQDSDLNLSHMMAIAQSTQYPDDCSDISDKTEKKSLVGDFLTKKNQNQPKDSGIEDDSTEESAKLKGKCKKFLDIKKSTPKQKYARKSAINNINTNQNSYNNDNNFGLEAEDASEVESLKGAETLGNYENGFIRNNEPHKEKHPPKIIGSEIVDKKYKIVGKKQEGLTEIPEEEEEIDVVGMEQCDESESSSWKLKESKENDEKREEKSEQRKIARKEEHRKKSNFGKDEKIKEYEAEKGDEEDESQEEVLTDRVEDEIEESDEGLEKIKKFIIKKPIDKKLINQERTPKKGKKSEKQSKNSKKEKESIQEPNKKDHESHIFSSSESDFEEQKEGMESPKKQFEQKDSLEEKDDSINEEGLKNEKQQEKRKVEEKVKDFSNDDDSESDKEERKQQERRKVSEKVKVVGSEEDSEDKNYKLKRKEIQQEKVNYSSSEEDSESEKPEVKQKEIIQQEKVKESSSEEESEGEKEVKQKEIHEPKNITERRKVKKLKEDSKSNEEEKENEDPKLKLGVENNDKKNKSGEVDEEKYEIEDNEDQEREELISEESNLKIVEKAFTDIQNIDSNETEKIENDNEDSNEVKMDSREIFTQFVDRKHDSESEEEKQDDEELRLTLEHEETYVNLDDNKIAIDEHKIEVSENPDMSDEGEEVMSAKSLEKVQQMKRLDLTMGSDSSSDEEFSQAQMNQDKKFVRKEKSYSSDSESEEDDKKKSPKKKDSPKKKSNEKKSPKKEKSPKKKEIPKDLVRSSGESEDDSKEDENEKITEVVQPDEDRDFYNYIQEGVSFLQQQIDGKERSSSQAIENVETQNFGSSQVISDPDTQIPLKNEKTKSTESRKKECLKYALANLESANTKLKKGIEHQVVVDEMQQLKENDKVITENFQKMTEYEELVKKENLIEYNVPTTINLQTIWDDFDMWSILIPEKEISKNLKREQMFYKESELQLGKKEYKASLLKPETLIFVCSSEESKMPYKTVEIKPVASLIVRPKNAFINTWSAENEPKRKRRKRCDTQESSVTISKEVTHPASNIPKNPKKKKKKKKLFTQESMLDLVEKKPEDNELESSQGSEAANTAQKRKRKHFLSESEEEKKVEPKVDVKQKKMWNIDEYALDEKPPVATPENLTGKKHKINKRIDNEDEKPEDNKFESFKSPQSVNTAQKRKRKHFLSESDEEEKVEPKVDVKQKKMWNIDEYALDEKPPVVIPENLTGKKNKIDKRLDNESGSSDVGLWEEKKPKKEKLKKEKKFNQFNERKGKSEASCLKIEKGKTVLSNLIAESSAKKEKYNSLDISKVKAKSDKEQKESDSLSINKVKNENDKKKKNKKILDKWIVEIASETEQKVEKLQLKNARKPEKKKKKSGRDSEKLNDSSTENKIEKTEGKNSQKIELSKTDHQSKKESLDKEDSSSDFEIKDKTKNKKKSKKLKRSLFFEEYSNWDDLNNQKEIEFKQEKTTKTMNGLINFEH